MALASGVTGDGFLVDSDSSERVYYVIAAGGGRNKYVETTTSTTRKWYALTQGAAETWRDATKATNESRRIAEDVRQVGSFTAESTIKTVTSVKTYEPEA